MEGNQNVHLKSLHDLILKNFNINLHIYRSLQVNKQNMLIILRK